MSATDPRDRPGPDARLSEWDTVVRDAVIHSAAHVDESEGLKEALRRIEGRPAVPRPKPIERLSIWLSGLLVPSPAFAVLAVVAVVQAVAIASLIAREDQDTDYAGFRSVSGGTLPTDPFLRVAFRPDARELDIRRVLHETSAEIVAGPSQLGEYYLLVPKGSTAGARAHLAANPHVESATLAEHLPHHEY